MKHKKSYKTLLKTAFALTFAVTVMFAFKTEAAAAEANPFDSAISSYLSEQYIEDYGLYEECMGDQFFFYTNVSNGGFTDQTVTFDIPSNLQAVFERNGSPYTYRGSISQQGNYVVRFYGTIGGTMYNANFRFSIREKAVKEEPEPVEEPAEEFEDVDTISIEDLEASEDDEITDEDIDQMIANAEAEFAEEEGLNVETDSYTLWGLSESYANERYIFTLASGEEIFSNVPMGAIVNEGVSIEVPAGMNVTVYKDGSNEAVNESGVDYVYTYTEDGFYRVVFESLTLNFETAYPEGTARPFITFRIVKDPVNDMDYITAPYNARFTKIGSKTFDVKNEDGDKNLDLDYYVMDEDNTYYFKVHDYVSDKNYEFVLQRDTTPPEVVCKMEKGKVLTNFKSNDIATIELYKDGILQTSESVASINKKGVYKMIVTDKAGNVTTKDFTINAYINAGSIIFLVLLVLIIVGSIGFIKVSKTRMRVR